MSRVNAVSIQIICVIGCIIGIIFGVRIQINWYNGSKSLALYFRVILNIALLFYWFVLICNTFELMVLYNYGKNVLYHASQFIAFVSYSILLLVVLFSMYARLKQVFVGTVFQPSNVVIKRITVVIGFVIIIGISGTIIYGNIYFFVCDTQIFNNRNINSCG